MGAPRRITFMRWDPLFQAHGVARKLLLLLLLLHISAAWADSA